MLFYLIFMSVASLIAFVPDGHKVKLNNACSFKTNTLILSCIIVGLVIGLRDGIGIDDAMYIRTYEEANSIGHAWRDIEASYIVICKLFNAIGLNGQSVILFYSLLGSIMIGNALRNLVEKDERPLVFLAFWAFFFADLFTAIRQLLAIGLWLNGYVEIKKRHRVRALLFAIAAFMIHYSSIFGILLLLILPVVKRIKPIIKIIILVTCYLLQFAPLVDIVLSIVKNIPVLGNTYYVKYFLSEGALYLFSDPIGLIATLMLIVTIIMIWKHKSLSMSEKERRGLKNVISFDELEAMSFLYWTSLMILSQFGYVRRVSYMLGLFMAAYLVKSINFFSARSKKVADMLEFLFFLSVFCYIVMNYKIRGTTEPVLIPYKITFDLI